MFETLTPTHGHRSYNTLIIHDVFFDSLLLYVNKQLNLHYICTKLYSVPLEDLNNRLASCKSQGIASFLFVYTGIQTRIHNNEYCLSSAFLTYTNSFKILFLKCLLNSAEDYTKRWANF